MELFPIIFEYINKESKILDLGCGFGRTCFGLYRAKYTNLFGVDINKSGIEFAKKKFSEFGMQNPKTYFKASDAKKIPFKDSLFDCVITQAFWTTIMPKERKDIVKEIYRVLKKEGVLYATIFTQTWRLPLYKQKYEAGIEKGFERGTFEAVDKKTGKVNYLAHHYTKEETEDLFEEANLKIEHYSKEIFTTQSGNKIDGYVIIARK